MYIVCECCVQRGSCRIKGRLCMLINLNVSNFVIDVGFPLTRTQIVELAENISQTLRDLKYIEKSNINKNGMREIKDAGYSYGKLNTNRRNLEYATLHSLLCFCLAAGTDGQIGGKVFKLYG